ncbi:hypothetical protein [Nocardioides sediminis]|uniref:hypothetical protein n=1 Tax=Nocardioides sediminis TaxID=433648 RepID=UPI000D3153A0|nr:hypothetical protein [Nocardioides sediminis]
MAKHTAYLHIGPVGIAVDSGVRDPLVAVSVVVPEVSDDDLERADLEIRRAHRAAGRRRKDVEGAWAKVCRRAFRTRSNIFLSLPGFAEADAGQAALALDGLHGLRVHLVVTAGAGELPTAWTRLVKPERVHALGAAVTPADVGEQVARIALADEHARLTKTLVRLRRRRTRVDERVAA